MKNTFSSHLYFKLFPEKCQTFFTVANRLIFYNLKFNFWNNRTAKSGEQVKLYAPLNYRTLKQLIYKGFRTSIW